MKIQTSLEYVKPLPSSRQINEQRIRNKILNKINYIAREREEREKDKLYCADIFKTKLLQQSYKAGIIPHFADKETEPWRV